MWLDDWRPWYDRISKTFNYSRSDDQAACELLSHLLEGKAIRDGELKKAIKGKPCIVFGAGPSIEEDVKDVIREGLRKNCTLIAADGATSALLLNRVVPKVIVSDLDGNIDDEIYCSRFGSLVVIHSHGDNMEALKKHVPRFRRAMGTTQVDPRPNVYNFGGFTDGDRAVILTLSMGAKMVTLAGMDFGREVGRYSGEKSRSLEDKLLKLSIGKELLEWVASKTDTLLLNLTGHGERIRGYHKISARELKDIIASL